MPRAIWSGSISFGLVNVPVKLFGATSKKDVRFHQLHDADGARLPQHLVALRPLEDALSMSSMLYADEVVSTDQLEDLPEDVEVSERELKMANQLIESLTSEWRPEQYRDDYRERVLELIEKKAAGQEIAVAAVEEEQAPVVDLMAALEASLAAAKDRRDEAPAEE